MPFECIEKPLCIFRGFPSSPVAMTLHFPLQGAWGLIPGWEDPLEKQMETHSSILAWKIPWTEEPGGLQSMGLQRVGTILSN